MEAETVRPLELLNRVARDRGWALCLTSTSDRRRDGKRVQTLREGAELSSLVLMQPDADQPDRREALFRGDLVARMPLEGKRHGLPEAIAVDEAAAWILEALGSQGMLDEDAA